jgi:hypothetical protein
MATIQVVISVSTVAICLIAAIVFAVRAGRPCFICIGSPLRDSVTKFTVENISSEPAKRDLRPAVAGRGRVSHTGPAGWTRAHLKYNVDEPCQSIRCRIVEKGCSS